MKCCNYSKLDLIRKGLLIEGGGNETIEFYASEIGAILEDEDIELYGEDDIVVDGPEPKEEQGTGNKEGKRRREKKEEQETGNKEGKRRREKKEEQGTGNKEGKRRRRKQEAAETITADSGSLYTSQSRNLAISQSESKSRVPALTSEQIRQGQSRVLRLIQLRMPPDIPTLVRACIDAGFTGGEIAALTGLGYHTIAKCKTGVVTSTVADRFQELFAFPRKPAAQEEA